MNNQNGGKPKTKTGLYVTLLVILMTVALVAAIAGAVARSTRGNEAVTTENTTESHEESAKGAHQDDTNDAFVTENETTKYDETAEKDTTAAETTAKKEAEDVLPEFINPTGGAIMKGCSTKTPVFSLTMDDYRTHEGVDISAAVGDGVKAAADGVISEVWDDPMMGKCVSISHSGGAQTTYKNLAVDLSENIEKGMSVTSGTVIGTVGESALEEIAEEPHLHFEMTVSSGSVNPEEYIDFASAVASYES